MLNGKMPIRIAYVTSGDPYTPGKRSWSGTLYHVGLALQHYCGDVTFTGPMDAILERLAGKVVHVGSRALLHKRYMYHHSALVARRFGRLATQRLARTEQPFDLVVACGAVDVAYLQTDCPIVLVLDATHARVCQYYPNYSHLLSQSCRELDDIERRAIQKSALLLYATNWAAQSALNDYQADPRKVHVVPFGANLEQPPPANVLDLRRRTDRCRLLFVGVDWARKGGAIAVETLTRLEAMGIPAELIVCGCTPPHEVSHPALRVIPYLNKHDAKQRAELETLYLTSDFLLLPTRNECYGIAFCEASAFGLPVVTTHTGGVPEIVRDGETGFVLPLSADGAAYAAVIARAYGDRALHAELVRASRAAFETRLNWDVWGTTAARLIAATLGRDVPAPLPERSN